MNTDHSEYETFYFQKGTMVPLYDTYPNSEATVGSSDGSELQVPIRLPYEETTTLIDSLFQLLGFSVNPFQTNHDEYGRRNTAASDLRLSMLSNFSTAYNVLSISLALKLMEKQSDIDPAAESLCSASLIGGMIVGQLFLGALGDVLGRHRAMAVVMLLQVSAAFASAFSFDCTFLGQPISLLQILVCWRFILGLGCGGVYPLSATLTAESSLNETDRAKSGALAFSFQGIGYLTLPVIAQCLLWLFGDSSELTWRILLGLGSVPGALLTAVRLRKSQSLSRNKLSEAIEPTPRTVPVSVMDAVLLERNLIRKLIGTAGSWLLFDILFYGNTLFTPVVLAAAFGESETVALAARDTMVLSLIAIPGYFVTVWAVGKQSPRWIQVQGFFAMGALYFIVGISFDIMKKRWQLLLVLYGLTFFFSNYGPNTTTFLLPSLTFNEACRSTLNGFSAACGKVGALIGASVFVAATNRFGQEIVFLCCAALSFVGVIITVFCVSGSIYRDQDLDESQSEIRPSEREELQLLRDTLPIKIVYSRPSLIDSNEGV